jgi:hypothetical protein
MSQEIDPNGPPYGPDANALERALKKAAAASRDPDAHEIAADDAGGSNVAEQSQSPDG